MTEKPFYKSKKFIYALSTFFSALILYAWLMLNPDMPQDQVDLLSELILVALTMGGLLLTGHTVTDVMAVWVNRPQPKPLGDAAHDLIDATPLATTPATNIFVNTSSDKPDEIARVVGEAVSRAQVPPVEIIGGSGAVR